ncbi:trypsin-like peptidase domain-containing protein [Alloacidobacterium sp.]|uniref:trypsin-like peptidase domain-containing protein n=1 Tax=Alloacidobacterium sp. TaxID=2951999 RepID=UPI002D33FD53|nr:trypsin-like peptidase domain-containing protein [Alloacidobacterium sp.]HYK36505.1 trypsin-like peptidase domain-containing protein [Alloacidobacterium sp.]
MKSLLERLRMRRLASTFTILATLSAGILIGSVVAHGVRGQEAKVDSSDATPLKVPSPRDLSTDFTKIAKEVGPAVVNISTETLPKDQQGGRRRGGQRFRQMPPQNPDGNGDDDDNQDQDGQGPGGQGGMQDFFNRFFGMGPDQMQPDDQAHEALGSGFIVDPKGYIITNNHVVDKADRIYVKLASDPDGNGPGRPAKVVGVDKATDLAVVKIDVDRPLPTVKLGNSESSQVGDWVIAIGSPLGQIGTVTAGIVSAKNRTIEGGPRGQFQHFIQTDAAINPGNSGGPLVNMAGEVVGVNTAIYTQTAGNQGIGFAMPSNTVVDVYNALIGPTHKMVRGSIGITFQPNISSAVQRVYGAKTGVIIRGVTPNMPADKAGLKPGDIITTIDGRPIKDGDDLVNDISARKPGSTVQLGYIRDGKQAVATVSIIDRTKMEAAVGQGGEEDENAPGNGSDASQSKLGITVADLPSNAPSSLHGVLIQSVKAGSFADEIGLSGLEGYVISSVNKQPVHNRAEYNSIISGLKSGQDVVFNVVDPQHPRDGGTLLGGTLP